MGSSKSFYNDCNKYRKIKLIKNTSTTRLQYDDLSNKKQTKRENPWNWD